MENWIAEQYPLGVSEKPSSLFLAHPSLQGLEAQKNTENLVVDAK